MLYDNLVARRRIQGVAAFSRTSHIGQLSVPGAVVLCATVGGETVGMTLWYVQGSVVYYHLGAVTDEGYRRGAFFAMFADALERFADGWLEWLDLGAGAGLQHDPDDGLLRFKQGWATGSRVAYLCGRVFDPAAYEKLSAGHGGHYFPAYRSEEFR